MQTRRLNIRYEVKAHINIGRIDWQTEVGLQQVKTKHKQLTTLAIRGHGARALLDDKSLI
jgi:hypothetical protein